MADSKSGNLVITKTFNAPRNQVFDAWTKPGHLVYWWAPNGFTTPACKVDLRVGGIFHYCMRSPDGKNYWGIGVYREILKPERLIYIDSFADEKGNPVPPTHYGMSAGHPSEAVVTVEFAELNGKTNLTLSHAVPAEFKEREEMQQGWSQMMERLASYLTEK